MNTEQDQAFQDQYYIDRTLEGDIKAFSALVERYKLMVYTLAVRMLRNHEEAEEVSQDVFLKAFKALKDFEGNSKFSTWIYKIAYNQSLDYLKKRAKLSKIQLVLTGETAYKANRPEIEVQIEADHRKYMVRRALNALSAEDSLIISLFYLEDLSIREISGIMGIRANSAKVRLHRARKRLTVLMGDYLPHLITERHG